MQADRQADEAGTPGKAGMERRATTRRRGREGEQSMEKRQTKGEGRREEGEGGKEEGGGGADHPMGGGR